jgi:hypothetical protein
VISCLSCHGKQHGKTTDPVRQKTRFWNEKSSLTRQMKRDRIQKLRVTQEHGNGKNGQPEAKNLNLEN